MNVEASRTIVVTMTQDEATRLLNDLNLVFGSDGAPISAKFTGLLHEALNSK